jgi:hypothetical protein
MHVSGAIKELAARVTAFERTRPTKAPQSRVDLFGAPTADPGVRVPVLDMSGPGMVRDVLAHYASLGPDRGVQSDILGTVRRAFGEEDGRRETWDRVSVVGPGRLGTGTGQTLGEGSCSSESGIVIMLPYCFFRSRGCGMHPSPF